MPRLFDDRLEQSDELIKQQQEENIKVQLATLQPVDGIILPDGKPAVVTNNNDIVPIGGNDTIGTLNQDGLINFVLNSEDTSATIYVNGESTYKSFPSKLSYKLSDIIKSGEIIVTAQNRDFTSPESYRITVVQNPNFDDTSFRDYQPVIKNLDGQLSVEPDFNKRIFTKTPAYSFKIDYLSNNLILSSEVTNELQNFKEFNFTFPKKSILPVIDNELVKTKTTSNLIVNYTGPNRAIRLATINNTTTTAQETFESFLTQGNNPFVFENATQFNISTTNTSLYKVISVEYIPEFGKKQTIAATGGESLIFPFTIDSNAVLNVIAEELAVQTIVKPTIRLLSSDSALKYNINSKSDLPLVLGLAGTPNLINVYVKDKTFTFTNDNVSNTEKGIILPASLFETLGAYKVILVARNIDTDSDPLELSINVVDETFVGVPDIKNITYPKEIVGADYAGTNVDFEILYESVNTDFVRIYINNSTGYFQEKASGAVKLNFQKLLEYVNYNTAANEKEITLFLRLVPYNISGSEELVGTEESITISLQRSELEIPREVAINRITEGFLSQLDDSIFNNQTSKYLTHLIHLGNGENKVITTWLGDRGTVIYKLYEPLDTIYQPNQELWVSKVISTPIIETITIIGEEKLACNPLKGPNFSLEVDNGISYHIYDELVSSGSVSSERLVTEYVNKKGIDTSQISITYATGSDYHFENFVNFSSAEERSRNFMYKIKLLEYFEVEKAKLSVSQSISQVNNFKKINDDILEIKTNFDGFEKYLYYTTNYDSNNLAYPKTNPSSSILLNSSASLVSNWYDNLIAKAEYFDKYNPNLLKNNIPEFLRDETENEDFILFLDMLGQHFDVLWVYITSLANKNNLSHNSNKGISNNLVVYMLESLGWQPKRAFDSQFLWEYVFGNYSDGRQKYSKSLKSANEEVWRRILNNLPYILKHKGTSRAMKAVMACYGVPQSMLTIMEFGGPQDPTKGGSSQFTFDDRTAAYYLSGSSSVKVPWVSSSLTNDYPNCIELRIKPDKLPDPIYTLISGSEWTLDLVKTTGSFGKLELNFGGDQAVSEYIVDTYFDLVYAFGPDYKTGSLDFPIFTEHYSNIAINRYNYPDSSSLYEVWLGTSDGKRIINSVSMSILCIDTQYSSGSYLQIGGNGYQGNIDEFRLWTVPLQKSKFNNHVLFPDAINGNSYTASSEDLLFRLDFEYPKDRTIDPYIKNVAISDSYGHASATASFTYNAPNYPYQYTPYDRTVTATVPSLGFGYSNKIRFESASLVGDLSYKSRATKKSFDQAPIDSNRLGLFFSPIKEINMDILKSFGDFNIDNYIGDYRDEYQDEYKTLSKLRNYYFDRMERNINEYIQLVRYIDKSLFDVLDDLAPARAKVSKGLLIEPHFLERSKTRWNKPESERNDHETKVSLLDTSVIESSYEVKEGELNNQNISTLIGEIPNYDGHVNAEEIYTLDATNPNYDGIINYDTTNLLIGETPFYETYIQAVDTGSNITGEVDAYGSTQIGMDRNSLDNLGFGLYAKSGVAVIRTWDGLFGNSETTGSRKSVFLVKEQKNKKVSIQTAGYPVNGALPGEQVKYENISVTENTFRVSIQPWGGTVATGNEVVEVTPINGYLPTHYKFKFIPEGLQRSYFKGSQQTAATTPDGLPVVETFTTNPNVLRVAKTGRGSGEPILEVD